MAIAAVIVLNVAFALFQELPAERAVEALAAFLPARARVWRGGRVQVVPAGTLVPGDLLVVREGESICAEERSAGAAAPHGYRPWSIGGRMRTLSVLGSVWTSRLFAARHRTTARRGKQRGSHANAPHQAVHHRQHGPMQ